MCRAHIPVLRSIPLTQLPDANETIEDLQLNGLRLIQKKDSFRFGMDSVLLAHFADIGLHDTVADLGSGNGVLIFLRYQEQWIAWIVEALLEGSINILSGQYVLLVLKAGYLTNSTYGYIKWTRYIRSHTQQKA